jgi:hypothetical protein
LEYCQTKSAAGVLAQPFVARLTSAFGLAAFVETGTYRGDTLDALYDDFEQLHSVEIGRALFEAAKARFAGRGKVHLTNADSAIGLAEVLRLSSLPPALLWLDAHYSGAGTAKGAGNTPVLAEVEAILAAKRPSDVILIDDLRCFWTPAAGFRPDDTLPGYPSAADIVAALNKDGENFDCFVLSDALLAIPSARRNAYAATPLLRALSESRIGASGAARTAALEAAISAAEGEELAAIEAIPPYIEGSTAFGLGGHYYYWRALVHGAKGARWQVRADAKIAAKLGATPPTSRLARGGRF